MTQKSEAFENMLNEEITEESEAVDLKQLMNQMFDELDEPLATETGKTSPSNQLLKTDYDEFNNLSAEELDNTSPIELGGLSEIQGGETTADNNGLQSSANKNMCAPTAESSHTDFSGSLGLFDDDFPLSLPMSKQTVTPIKTATARSINLECFDQSFRKMINHMPLQSMGIYDFSTGISKYEQCQSLINFQINESIKSALFTYLKEESKKFKALEKILSKTLQSTNINTRIESREYVFSLGFDIKNSELASVIFLNVNRPEIEYDLKKIIKKAQRKKSRSKSAKQKTKITVLIKNGSLEKLKLSSSYKFLKSKAGILRDLFDSFLQLSNKEQVALLRESMAADIKKPTPQVIRTSHIKTDFLVSNEKNEAINKLLKKHDIQIQKLANILVNNAIEECSSIAEHTQNLKNQAVTASAQSQPSTPDTRPPNPHYEISEEEKLTPKPSGISPDKMKG